MREENKEIHAKTLNDELPIDCCLTGTGRLTNQLYRRNGLSAEQHKSYDYSFQCQQFDERISLYVICSGNRFSEFAKEHLVANILYGQYNDNSPEDVKCVLKQAFTSLEQDYSNWIDIHLTQQIETVEEVSDSTKKPFDGIHIAIALLYNFKLYTCNVGHCRIILCKTDNNNVLRAVQISTDYDSDTSNGAETLLPRLEIVGPIPLNESHRFLVLMSSGLCKTLENVYNDEQQNINRELIQAIVHQFRIQPSLMAVAQTTIEGIVAQCYANYIEQSNGAQMNADVTLMIRNFNFPLPNEARKHQGQVTFNPVHKEHILTNTTMTSHIQSGCTDTANSNHTNSSATTSSSIRSEFFDRNIRISPYVNFADYYNNVEITRRNGTLPANVQFD